MGAITFGSAKDQDYHTLDKLTQPFETTSSYIILSV